MQLGKQKNQAITLFNSKSKIFKGMLPVGGASVETVLKCWEKQKHLFNHKESAL